MPVDSGLLSINLNDSNGAYLVDSNNNEINYSVKYLPGTKIDVSVLPKDEYNLESVKINGKSSKDNTYSGYITSDINFDVKSNKIVKEMKYTTISGIRDLTYTGQFLIQDITINNGNSKLREGIDYYLEYSNNLNPGKAKIKIYGIGDYSGTVTKTFNIIPSQIQGIKVTNQSQTTITLGWNANSGNVTGYKIYSFNYDKQTWEYVGKTSGTTYKVKGLEAGTLYKYRVRAYINIDGQQKFGIYSSPLKTSTKTAIPTISQVIGRYGKATVQFKKVSGADGYQIQYSTDKNFGNNNKKITVSKNATSKVIYDLNSKSKYYFRIRAYKTVAGNTVYSSYSNVVAAKIK